MFVLFPETLSEKDFTVENNNKQDTALNFNHSKYTYLL